MNTVTTCWRAYVKHRITYTLCYTTLDFVMIDQTYAHRVNEWVPVVRIIEHHFAADRWNTDTVPVTGNP
ncbi:hypothetical protein D3C78_1542430 [compost metagenome]